MHVERVAIIGAGVSGVVSAKNLGAAGLQVKVFERSSTLGGIWNYDERQPPEPSYPSTQPSLGDAAPIEVYGCHGDTLKIAVNGSRALTEIELRHSPPGPAYQGLTNNIPTYLLELKESPWKENTEDYVNHRLVLEYIRSFARNNDVEKVVKYNTRVERVEKQGSKWVLSTSTLVKEGTERGRLEYDTEEFDAVVVASGHYHAAKVPDLPGLKEWKQAWPNRVSHSKSYRNPTNLTDQNILLIGAGVSSTDIANEASGFAKNIYQVARNSPFDIPARFLPPNAERVSQIASFGNPAATPNENSSQPSELKNLDPIPASVTLSDGRILENIHRVIICTGYHISYPFLKHLHSDTTPLEAADERVLVTNGTQVHNLHKDIFYMPDPTLAFVGTAYSASSFSLFEFQAIAVAAVFSGRAKLPTEEEMRDEYRLRVARKGLGKSFHMLKDEEVEYVNSVVQWINQDPPSAGIKPVEGHSEKWLQKNTERREWIKKIFAGNTTIVV
ncbi:hypothetical protein O988_01151 [Pseudogymnoascus sp. VKM F-3808]|nr:hypothetical protein O988_01151 [Pseudogymnoascus sp. VKM F-3808]